MPKTFGLYPIIVKFGEVGVPIVGTPEGTDRISVDCGLAFMTRNGDTSYPSTWTVEGVKEAIDNHKGYYKEPTVFIGTFSASVEREPLIENGFVPVTEYRGAHGVQTGMVLWIRIPPERKMEKKDEWYIDLRKKLTGWKKPKNVE